MGDKSFAEMGLDDAIEVIDYSPGIASTPTPPRITVSPRMSAPIPLLAPATMSTPPFPAKTALQVLQDADKVFDFAAKGLTPSQQVYIVAYLTHGTKLRACQSVGIDPRAVTRWEKDDEVFAEVYKEALLMVTDILEEEAMRRALGGSDKLLVTLLKANNPERFADKRIQKHEGKIEHEIISWADLAKQAAGEVIEVDAEVVMEDVEVSDVQPEGES